MEELEQIKKELAALATPKRAKALMRFFKTGKGEYGEGDIFLGISVPEQRVVAKRHQSTPLPLVIKLLRSREHELRLTALFILVLQFSRGTAIEKSRIYQHYLKNTQFINNWDLVDSSAPYIPGAFLADESIGPLISLAHSKSLWERRIAIVATLAAIYRKKAEPTLRIARILLHDQHDLIHKATGWMLREVGKRCGIRIERDFLDEHYSEMPRTMLRYAIERFPEEIRKHYLE